MPEMTRAGNRVRVTVEVVNSYGHPQRDFPAVYRVFEFSNDAISGKVAGSEIGREIVKLCQAIEANPEAYHRKAGGTDGE